MTEKTMTIKEIAGLCEVAESTIRSWIGKTAETAGITAKTADSQGKAPVAFTLPEVLAIIRAGGKNTLAALLEENVKESATVELPDWRKLRELRLMAEKGVITPYQVQVMIGAPWSRRTIEGGAPKYPPRLPARRPSRAAKTGHNYEEGIEIIETLKYPIEVRTLGAALGIDYATVCNYARDLGIYGGGYSKEQAALIWYSLYWGRDEAEAFIQKGHLLPAQTIV